MYCMPPLQSLVSGRTTHHYKITHQKTLQTAFQTLIVVTTHLTMSTSVHLMAKRPHVFEMI